MRTPAHHLAVALATLLMALLPLTAQAYNATQLKARQWALNVPKAVTATIPTLGSHLAQVSADEYTRALTVYFWVAEHITYDHASLKAHRAGGEMGPQDAPSVLASRIAVCEGYANLYQALCEQAGLEAEKVVGYAKGATFLQLQRFDGTNHAWNAVRIYGEWKLVDACWGASEKPGAPADLYYFAASPTQMLAHHLPEDARWQLLRRPMAYDEFVSNPIIWDGFHHMAFEGFEPHVPQLAAKAQTVTLRHAFAPDFRYHASLKDANGNYSHVPVAVKPSTGGVRLDLDLSGHEGMLDIAAIAPDGQARTVISYIVNAPAAATVSMK